MATEVKQGTSVEVNSIAADWDWGSYDAANPVPKLSYISFIPGAANDVLQVKDGSASGPVICQMTSGDGEERTVYFHGARKQPFVDFSECTLTAGHKVLIGLWPQKR